MKMERISFDYCTGSLVQAKTLANWREVGRYISGIDISDNRYKTFRKDRIASYAGGGEHALLDPYPPPPVAPGKLADDSPHILFTGFPAAQRADLEARAARAGMDVRKTVTRTCMYLVAGPTAGPTKVERARELGCYILRADEFLLLLDTGALPDDPDPRLTDC